MRGPRFAGTERGPHSTAATFVSRRVRGVSADRRLRERKQTVPPACSISIIGPITVGQHFLEIGLSSHCAADVTCASRWTWRPPESGTRRPSGLPLSNDWLVSICFSHRRFLAAFLPKLHLPRHDVVTAWTHVCAPVVKWFCRFDHRNPHHASAHQTFRVYRRIDHWNLHSQMIRSCVRARR